MKKVIRLTENDLIRIVKRVINEQSQMVEQQTPNNTVGSLPAVYGIEIMGNKITRTNQTNANVSGVVNVVNCESSTGTYIVNNKKYDMGLVRQALGTDTIIRVYAMNPNDSVLTIVADSQPLKDLSIRFEFPIAKIPNVSDDTIFYVIPFKEGKPIKYDNKTIRVQCEGFMLT